MELGVRNLKLLGELIVCEQNSIIRKSLFNSIEAELSSHGRDDRTTFVP